MKENLDNKDWRADGPKLATLTANNPFSVPEGYFEQSESQILDTVFIDGLRNKSKTGFTAPQNYFDTLSDEIEAKIAMETLVVTKVNPFTVPEQYFDTLQASINAKIEMPKISKKVKIFRLWQRDLMKYASVACFVLISASGIYYYQNSLLSIPQAQTLDFTNEQILYDIDENVIIDHLNTDAPTNNDVSSSDKELESYILNNYSPSDLMQELKQ